MNTVFLTSFSHEVHLEFAKAIDADILDFRSTYQGIGQTTPFGDAICATRWPDYDIYVIEGSAPLYAAAARSVLDDAIIIYLGADRGMFSLNPASGSTERDSVFESFLEHIGLPAVRTIAQHTIDGALVISDFIADYTRAIVGPKTPIRVAHPFIKSNTYESLQRVDPDLSNTIAVTVGRAMEYKGMSRLVDVWPQIREVHNDAELHIVGPGGHPTKYEQTPGVSVQGFVENLADVFNSASLFIQPSRGDAFAVSTVEAMHAGVPAIVTMTTGARSEVRAVDGDLVVDSSANAIAEGIINYFHNDIDSRRELSHRARERGANFDPESRKVAFRKAFESLLREIKRKKNTLN